MCTYHRRVALSDFRLALERASSASEAVNVITSLLETHGQGGPGFEKADGNITYDNSYMIADHSEVWILETASQHWAAQKVTGAYNTWSLDAEVGITCQSLISPYVGSEKCGIDTVISHS